MLKKISLFILLGSIFIIGGGCKQQNNNSSQTSTVTSTVYSNSSDTIFGETKITNKEIKEENKKLFYTVNGQIPQISGVMNQERVNKLIEKIVSEAIEQFKKDTEDWNKELNINNNFPITESVQSGLNIDYEVHFASSEFVSISFRASPYFAGAAHPTYYFIPFNYNLASFKKVALDDLFLKNTFYLDKLSVFADEQLKNKAGFVWESGIKHGGNFFKNFTLTKNHLIISFNDAEIAPHAAGEQRLEIPWKQLESIVDKNVPLKYVFQYEK